MAVATAFFAVVGFLYKHKGAVGSPPVEWSRPVRTSLALFRNRWYVLGIVIAIGSWGFHVAALALAPISLVQSVIAGGLVLLTVVADRLFAHEVTRREWIGVAPRRPRPRLPRRHPRGLRRRRPLRLRGGDAGDLPRRRSRRWRSRVAVVGWRTGHAGVALGASAGPLLGRLRHRDQGPDRHLRREPRDRLRQPARPAHHRRLVRRPHRLGEEPPDRQGGPGDRDDHASPPTR